MAREEGTMKVKMFEEDIKFYDEFSCNKISLSTCDTSKYLT